MAALGGTVSGSDRVAMDFRTLRTLIAIADYRTFAAASRVLGLTQSAVSLQMKALETELGRVLFDRTHRPPSLSADGRALVDRAREIVTLYDQLQVSFRPEAIPSRLSIGAVPTTLTGVLPAALGRLRQHHPSLKISLSAGLSHELEHRVLAGEFDLAVVTEPERVQVGLTWETVAEETLVVIAPPGTPGDTDKAVLTSMPFIRFKRFAWASRIIDARLRDRGITVDPAIEIDSLDGVNQLVLNGLGVSVVPRRHIPDPFPKDVRVLPFGDPPATRAIGVIQPTDPLQPDLARELIGELRGLCAADSGGDRPA